MRAKPGELKAYWNSRESDVDFAWGGEGATKPDGGMLCHALCEQKGLYDRTLVQELEHRGFDISTLRFSIRRKPGIPR